MDELACQCATFINGCLGSDCDVVNFVEHHGVYFKIMLSPIGRNSLFCCRRFGVRLSAITDVNKSFIRAHYHCQLTISHSRTVQLLLELLFVKFGISLFHANLRSFLEVVQDLIWPLSILAH